MLVFNGEIENKKKSDKTIPLKHAPQLSAIERRKNIDTQIPIKRLSASNANFLKSLGFVVRK